MRDIFQLFELSPFNRSHQLFEFVGNTQFAYDIMNNTFGYSFKENWF